MGTFLSTPERRVESEFGFSKDGTLLFSAGSVQGWRKTMEDAHIADAENKIFAVFDGHGGKAVAKFAQTKFVKELTSLPSFKEGQYELALKQAFHRIDEMLEDPKYDSLLARFQAIPNPSEKKVGEAVDSEWDIEEDERDDSENIARDSNLSINQPIGLPKKKVTTAQAVQFFQQLLVAEANKSKGLADASSSSAKMAYAAVTSANAKALASANASSSSAPRPACIQTPNGPVCCLGDHRVVSGCTAIVALKINHQLFVANAGDSRGCLYRSGRAIPLSEDHKPQSETEMRRIEKAGGFVSAQGRINGNLNLSRSLGDLKYKQMHHLSREEQMITAEPDVTITTLVPDDSFFVLACDGIWDVMTCQELCDFISVRLDTGMDLTEVIKQVFDHCIADDIKTSGGLGGDNQTCLVVLLNYHPHVQDDE